MTEGNRAIIAGIVRGEAALDHEAFGTRFYTFDISTKRLSGAIDTLPVIFPEDCAAAWPRDGYAVCVEGALRSKRVREGEKERLKIAVFTRSVTPWGGESVNAIHLTGTLSGQPKLRLTPLGREICDFMLICQRSGTKRLDAIPCIAWERGARALSRLNQGDSLRVEGRFQSRVYDKALPDGTSEQRTALEASVSRFETL